MRFDAVDLGVGTEWGIRRLDMKKVIISMGIVAAVVVVGVFVPIVEVPYRVTVEYEDTETYYEAEPYEVVETYTETVPLDYEVVKSEAYVQGTTFFGSVEVRNKDSTSGVFTVDFLVVYGCTFISPGSIHITSHYVPHQEELHLAPNGKKTATVTVDNDDPASCDVDSWNYDVIPSTKEVEKERTVIEYKQVEKERTVAREREETHYKRVPIFEYLRSVL